jgi:hypothetical protein
MEINLAEYYLEEFHSLSVEYYLEGFHSLGVWKDMTTSLRRS